MRCTCVKFGMQINAKVITLLLLVVQAIKAVGSECSKVITECRLHHMRSIHNVWTGSCVVVPAVVAAFFNHRFPKVVCART